MTTKLYPFSKSNFAKLRNYAENIASKATEADKNGNAELFEKLWSEAIRVYSIGMDEYSNIRIDKGCVWLTGKEIGEAKKILAMS